MKRQLLILVLLSFVFSCTDRQPVSPGDVTPTEIGGSISGTLEFRNSPFFVTRSLIVVANTSLNIQPKVQLLFADSTMLVVHGVLTCISDSGRAILFTAKDEHWLGLKFVNGTDQSQLRFCRIEKVRLTRPDSLQNCAIEVLNSDLVVENTLIHDNTSVFGGGLYAEESQVLITNSIFRDNDSNNFGGAMLLSKSTARVYNNTLFRNTTFNYGGGLVVIEPVDVDVQNNIFFLNSNTTGDPRISLIRADSSNFNQAYNLLWQGTLDPKFVSDDDLHLRFDSIAIDAGNPDPLFNDFDGSRNDQGAYGGPLGDW